MKARAIQAQSMDRKLCRAENASPQELEYGDGRKTETRVGLVISSVELVRTDFIDARANSLIGYQATTRLVIALLAMLLGGCAAVWTERGAVPTDHAISFDNKAGTKIAKDDYDAVVQIAGYAAGFGLCGPLVPIFTRAKQNGSGGPARTILDRQSRFFSPKIKETKFRARTLRVVIGNNIYGPDKVKGVVQLRRSTLPIVAD